MSLTELAAVLESILFVHGEPISLEKLSKAIDSPKDKVESALAELKKTLDSSGLVLLEKDGEYQLGSKPEYAKYIQEFLKTEFSEEMSPAALEVATIIAYRGPITRVEIEYLRGVNSSFTLRNLLIRGLVERFENPKDARSYLYRISFDFLKHLGLKRLEDLPQYKEFKNQSLEIEENSKLENKNSS